MRQVVLIAAAAALAFAMAGCLDWSVTGSVRLKLDGYNLDVAVTQPATP